MNTPGFIAFTMLKSFLNKDLCITYNCSVYAIYILQIGIAYVMHFEMNIT